SASSRETCPKRSGGRMLLAEKGVRGKAAGLAPPQHTETRSATSAPQLDVEIRKITSAGRVLRKSTSEYWTPEPARRGANLRSAVRCLHETRNLGSSRRPASSHTW